MEKEKLIISHDSFENLELIMNCINKLYKKNNILCITKDKLTTGEDAFFLYSTSNFKGNVDRLIFDVGVFFGLLIANNNNINKKKE